jgi:hypothetical protein
MRTLILLLLTTWVIFGCKESSKSSSVATQDTAQHKPNTSSVDGNENELNIAQEEAGETNCGFKDGTHPAAVTYYNPKTKHTAQYDLKVHVKHCTIIRIDFPNGGWLDEKHIPQTQINEKEAVLKDDKGRQWKIHLN